MIRTLSICLGLGLLFSQVLPVVIGEGYNLVNHPRHFIMMVLLCFIMIRVGAEFVIDKSNLKQYRFDALIGSLQATVPWFLAAVYVHFILLPQLGESWPASKTLLAGRFAAPTSAGVLFTMLAAAKLTKSWTYGKARVLAIFDDIETVALMIPLLIIKNGFSWHSAIELSVMGVLLWAGWRFQHIIRLPRTWTWTMFYSVVLTLVCAACRIEVLLPAFALGWTMKFQNAEEFLKQRVESRASKVISCVFLTMVGLSMPVMFGDTGTGMPLPIVFLHAVNLMILICLGKLVPFLAYRGQNANWRERLSLSIAMFARGEMGLAVLVVSQAQGIGGAVVQIAMMCLAMNQMMTGLFIGAVLWLSNPRNGLLDGPLGRLLVAWRKRFKPRLINDFQQFALTLQTNASLTASSLIIGAICICVSLGVTSGNESTRSAGHDRVVAVALDRSHLQRRNLARRHRPVTEPKTAHPPKPQPESVAADTTIFVWRRIDSENHSALDDASHPAVLLWQFDFEGKTKVMPRSVEAVCLAAPTAEGLAQLCAVISGDVAAE